MGPISVRGIAAHDAALGENPHNVYLGHSSAALALLCFVAYHPHFRIGTPDDGVLDIRHEKGTGITAYTASARSLRAARVSISSGFGPPTTP